MASPSRLTLPFAALTVGFVACSSDMTATTSTGAGGGLGGSSGQTTTTTTGSHSSATASSTSGAGGSVPIPIKHVIVIVKENHTFDNYFGSFPGAEGTSTYKLKSGAVMPVPHAPNSTPHDLCHEHSCALTDWNGGAMDGWDGNSDDLMYGDGLAWAQYQESDIPNYWAYAKNFVLADHFHANMLGPSFPGHMMFLAGQAGWAIGNPGFSFLHPFWGCDQGSTTRVDVLHDGTCQVDSVFPCFSIPSIPDVLPIDVTWKFYGTDFYNPLWQPWSMFNAINGVRNDPSRWSHIVLASSEFQKDLDNHTLPNVSYLVDQDLDSEHPGTQFGVTIGKICPGENWTVNYINKVMQSSYWPETAILVSWDDFGGWYDHVPPPANKAYGCDPQHPYGLGFRVPLLIISPYAKPHFIFHELSEQASVPRFIEKVFGAPAMSTLDPAARDGQANDLMNAFDWNQTPLPPLVLPIRNCP